MIYLCRHGETDFNFQRRIQGRLESDLNPLGRRQAAAMGDLLQDLLSLEAKGGWRLIASPLRRAQDTARAISDRIDVPVETDVRLIEVGVGAWEGRLRDALALEHPTLFKDPDWVFHGPGGETYDQVLARVSAWLAEQAPEPERRLIVVSHGVAGRLFRAAYAGLSKAAALRGAAPQDAIFRLQNGQVDRLACEPLGRSAGAD